MDEFSGDWKWKLLYAWIVGWIVYMIAMVLTVYDGIPSLILQPFCAAIVSAMAVVVCLILKVIFWVTPIGRTWNSTPAFAMALFVASVVLLCLGEQSWLPPETGIGSYVGIVFAIANFPEVAPPPETVLGVSAAEQTASCETESAE